MTAYHPYPRGHSQPYVSYDEQQHMLAQLESMNSLFAEVDAYRQINARPTSGTASHFTDSANAASSIAPIQYPHHTQANLNLYVTPPTEPATPAHNEDLLNYVPVDMPASDLELEQWLNPAMVQSIPTMYHSAPSPPLQQGSPSTSSMINPHDQASIVLSVPAPQLTLDQRPRAQPQPQPRRQSPVSSGQQAVNNPNSRRSSPGGPSRVRVRDLKRPPACDKCKTLKAKCTSSSLNDPCYQCQKNGHECTRAERKPKNQAPRIKDLNQQIKDVSEKIQRRLEEILGPNALLHRNWRDLLDSSEHRRCDCPVPPTTALVAEGNTSPTTTSATATMVHRAGCPAADPMGLYARARLMEMLDPNPQMDEDGEGDSEDFVTGSEEEDRYHDPSLSLPNVSSGAPVAIFFELSRALDSPSRGNVALGSPARSHSSMDVGLAGADYFTPNPAASPAIKRIVIERERLPSYLVNGIVRPSEFMKYWNVSVSVLDPGLHVSARAVLARCPFLFTVVLAIAARDFHKPEFYPLLMQEAKTMAGPALVEWCKSVEIVQAFILLATFPAPARRWDEDRTFSYLGYAIRMAADLELNRPAEHPFPSEMAEREHLNRIRTWLICHNLDVSTAAKLGKATTIQEDAVIIGSRSWWRASKYNSKYDIHLCAFTQILIIFHKYFRLLGADSSSLHGHNNNVDVGVLADQFSKEIDNFQLEFERIFAEESDHKDSSCEYRAHARYTAHFFRLVIYSICHRRACAQGTRASDEILLRCLDAASRLVKAMNEHHANSDYFKYSAEGWFTFGAFAAAFMVKVLCPTFAPILDQSYRQHLRGLVMQLINAYQSKKVSIDERHTPSIYARFLTRLLTRADELNGTTPVAADELQAARLSASPQIKADVDDMSDLFGFPQLHSM